MAKRDEKLTHAAHIKRHTAGTSNEISFSVLDAAKNALDGEDANTRVHTPLFGRIALFTLPGRKKPIATPTKPQGLHLPSGDFIEADTEGRPTPFLPIEGVDAASSRSLEGASMIPKQSAASGASVSSAAAAPKRTRSPEEEIARRKAHRKLSKIVAIVVVVAISLALLVAAGTYLYRDYQKNQANMNQLGGAVSLVTEADTTLLLLDEVVEQPFAEGAEEKRAEVTEKLEQTIISLDEADELARAASAELKDANEKEIANQTVATIDARKTLVDTGSQMMAVASATTEATTHLDAAWQYMLDANEKAREAAALVTETTEENVQASKDKTNEALAALEQARAELTAAQNVLPAVDVSAYSTYIDKRAEAFGYAIASDDAFLARNKEEAVAQNDAYNKADAEAAELAKDLPDVPSAIAQSAYEAEVEELSKTYATARSQAATADAFILDYLGEGNK